MIYEGLCGQLKQIIELKIYDWWSYLVGNIDMFFADKHTDLEKFGLNVEFYVDN